ncbi:2-C-methyl-D-erythritol 4-phosphate cytidylyltransferase [Pseudorhodoferax sp. Leaf267]|uniref:2-C-methyl-D-erythritol 4-phosphate cytidylyltransferase n=1 Tax=Pseudorhodoferax sp. Leaf267 TaxID=1736316 RepID=UPI0006FB566F|nr:2-C-methyl-D-erythritol 4-phosphate cytidylyltransferase [Pseudorhodoferax sp. Leaf267]KQP17717.1 2-C-methyl-D-erythritol 4-phosphate cytidylyltransferase [Pseudorhodoferax sp. Leaf267]
MSPVPDPGEAAPAPRFFALIPCAGSGSRALAPGAVLPKQYQAIAGQPMVMHTLAAFAGVGRISDVLVVVAHGDDFFEHHSAPCVVRDNGGATRAQSVRNGLHDLFEQGARGHDWVLVHDAARCLITPGQIDALIDACAGDAVGGLLAHKLPDTLKQEGAQPGRVAATLPRADKWLAQTPQMFRIDLLSRALDAALAGDAAQVTDEASAIEAQGLAPLLVPGSALNFKVTYPEDFALAEQVLRGRQEGTP